VALIASVTGVACPAYASSARTSDTCPVAPVTEKPSSPVPATVTGIATPSAVRTMLRVGSRVTDTLFAASTYSWSPSVVVSTSR